MSNNLKHTVEEWRDWPEVKEFDDAAVEFAKGSWQIFETIGLPHVIPYQDLREHDITEACWCAPYHDDGVIVHNSMDQRERYERGEIMEM